MVYWKSSKPLATHIQIATHGITGFEYMSASNSGQAIGHRLCDCFSGALHDGGDPTVCILFGVLSGGDSFLVCIQPEGCVKRNILLVRITPNDGILVICGKPNSPIYISFVSHMQRSRGCLL